MKKSLYIIFFLAFRAAAQVYFLDNPIRVSSPPSYGFQVTSSNGSVTVSQQPPLRPLPGPLSPQILPDFKDIDLSVGTGFNLIGNAGQSNLMTGATASNAPTLLVQAGAGGNANPVSGDGGNGGDINILPGNYGTGGDNNGFFGNIYIGNTNDEPNSLQGGNITIQNGDNDNLVIATGLYGSEGQLYLETGANGDTYIFGGVNSDIYIAGARTHLGGLVFSTNIIGNIIGVTNSIVLSQPSVVNVPTYTGTLTNWLWGVSNGVPFRACTNNGAGTITFIKL